MNNIPRIKFVKAINKYELSVLFDNGSERVYDCTNILKLPAFRLLKDPAFFKTVRVDIGGYGIIWNDDIDLSEYELWTNGKETQATH
jgi:hypothetical protein